MSATSNVDFKTNTPKITLDYDVGPGPYYSVRFYTPAELCAFLKNPPRYAPPIGSVINVYGLASADLQALFAVVNTRKQVTDLTLFEMRDIDLPNGLMIPHSLEQLDFIYCAQNVKHAATAAFTHFRPHVRITEDDPVLGMVPGAKRFRFHNTFPNRLETPAEYMDFPVHWF